MGFLKQAITFILRGDQDRPAHDEPTFRCIRCGAEHDREYRTCPDCGAQWVIEVDGDGDGGERAPAPTRDDES